MKLRPYPHQLAGAEHLAARTVAGLFDDPRVGKNLATILALDRVGAKKVLFVTTVSGRAVARQAFADNQEIPRKIQILEPGREITGDLVIVSWASVNNPKMRAKLLAQLWDTIVLDESHYAKSFTAQRTRNVYGTPRLDGQGLDQSQALCVRAKRVWLLTGTPLPHDLSDIYPAMRALTPELLLGHNGFPDVTTISRFDERYTVQKLIKPTPRFSKMIKIGGKNESELKARLKGGGFFLRRTQAQIGILEPRYSMRPLIADADRIPEAGMSREEVEEILASQRYSDKGLARLMHIHGTIKAEAVIEAVDEEIDCGLDKIVLGYWHHDVRDILMDGLEQHGIVGIDGETPFIRRELMVREFSSPSEHAPKIFLQQIAAAGESIDLSASSLLWFVESIFQPGAMKQASERVTNLNNKRAPVVETCVIAGSIDELIQDRLTALWTAINRVIR
jgi:SWI/SNF-related matrix-associated actin-dependent regulator 1 of chromatin subfamily A